MTMGVLLTVTPCNSTCMNLWAVGLAWDGLSLWEVRVSIGACVLWWIARRRTREFIMVTTIDSVLAQSDEVVVLVVAPRPVGQSRSDCLGIE